MRHPLVLFLPLQRSKQNSERVRDVPETAQQQVAEMGPSAGGRPSRGVGVESAAGDGGGRHRDCPMLPEQHPGRTHLSPAEPFLQRRRLPDKWAGPALEPAPPLTGAAWDFKHDPQNNSSCNSGLHQAGCAPVPMFGDFSDPLPPRGDSPPRSGGAKVQPPQRR